MTISRLAATLAAATTLAITAGCASSDSPPVAGPPTAASEASSPVPQSSTPAAAVPDSLRFTATTVDGKAFDAAILAGKPVVLWFWAAWCPRCRAAAGHVAATQQTHAGKVHVVGVAGLGSGQAPMAKFVADTGIGAFPHLADDQGAVWKKFGVTTQEYFVIIDAAGNIVHKGPLSSSDLTARVTALAG